jgi:integrase
MLAKTTAPPANDISARKYLRRVRAIKALPKGVHFQAHTLKDGSVVYYGYYRRGVRRIALGRLGTPEFEHALTDMETRCKEVAPGTLHYLIWRYKTSPEFSKLRAITKQNYRRKLDMIQARFGALPLEQVEAQSFSAEIFAWRDERAAAPRQADFGIQVLKLLLSWGCRRGLIEVNRALRIDRLQKYKRGGRSWSEDQIEAFLAVAPPNMRFALILALETGQRQGDLLRLDWSSVADGVIQLKQSKRGVDVAVPISPRLQEEIDRNGGAKVGPVLVKADARPWDKRGNGFRAGWRILCQEADIKGPTFHDLRGTFITRRLSEGWTPVEVAMCTGHTLRDLASLDIYADRSVLARALATRRFLQTSDVSSARRSTSSADGS